MHQRGCEWKHTHEPFLNKREELTKVIQGVKNPLEGMEFGAYFYILSMVVLTGPSKQFSNTPSQEGQEAFGPDRLPRWGEVGQDDRVNEDEEEEIDEPYCSH